MRVSSCCRFKGQVSPVRERLQADSYYHHRSKFCVVLLILSASRSVTPTLTHQIFIEQLLGARHWRYKTDIVHPSWISDCNGEDDS